MSRAAFARPLRIIKTKGGAAVPWYERDLLFSAFVRRLLFMSTSSPPLSDVAGHDSEIATLYRRAFADYRTCALWNLRQFEDPTIEQALSVARHLRVEGDMGARHLAEQIEKAARAGL